MKSVLTKISAPLLIGSILALGALAYPAKADAGEPTFVFRLKAALVKPVVADKGDGETGKGSDGSSDTGGEEAQPKEPFDASAFGWTPMPEGGFVDLDGDGKIGEGDAIDLRLAIADRNGRIPDAAEFLVLLGMPSQQTTFTCENMHNCTKRFTVSRDLACELAQSRPEGDASIFPQITTFLMNLTADGQVYDIQEVGPPILNDIVPTDIAEACGT
jgi:hypothetical protein